VVGASMVVLPPKMNKLREATVNGEVYVVESASIFGVVFALMTAFM